MTIRTLAVALAAALVAAGPLGGEAAEDPLAGDLRDLRVGMSVAELPAEGYVEFACGNDGAAPGPAIAGWQAYAACPADAAGLHEVAFRYDESLNPWAQVNDDWKGTRVAGHPVVPSLLIDERGVVRGLRIVTDPSARLYHKKKAFLMYIRVMGRYGQDGWACVEREPAEGRMPVGGMYIDRSCEKQFHDRRLLLDTDLYRTAEQRGQEFTGRTRLEILAAG
jgi:hypothetical protein